MKAGIERRAVRVARARRRGGRDLGAAQGAERVERLLRTYGPFQLALLECVLIACDWKASKAVEERA